MSSNEDSEYQYSDHKEEDDIQDNENTEQDDQTIVQNYDYKSEEDWESEDTWDPNDTKVVVPDFQEQWQSFVKKRISEGHFCPIDLHMPRIFNKPQREEYIPGQFDDASDNEKH